MQNQWNFLNWKSILNMEIFLFPTQILSESKSVNHFFPFMWMVLKNLQFISNYAWNLMIRKPFPDMVRYFSEIKESMIQCLFLSWDEKDVHIMEVFLKEHNLPLTLQWVVIDVFLMGFSNKQPLKWGWIITRVGRNPISH